MGQASLQLQHGTGDLIPNANLSSVMHRRSSVMGTVRSMTATSGGGVMTRSGVAGVSVGVDGRRGLDSFASCITAAKASLLGRKC